MESMTDPCQRSLELASISAGVIASEQTKEDLISGHEKGERQMQELLEKRIISNYVDFFDPLSKLELSTFLTIL